MLVAAQRYIHASPERLNEMGIVCFPGTSSRKSENLRRPRQLHYRAVPSPSSKPLFRAPRRFLVRPRGARCIPLWRLPNPRQLTTAVTLVGLGVQTCRVCPKLPPRHSVQSFQRRTDFGGENTEAAPYPPWSSVCRFGSVSAAVDWQGLDAPFIVELFTFRCFGGYPELVTLRRGGVATARLPTPARVPRTCRALHPIGHSGFGPCPAGGLGSP